ncbi:MAG: hypothetical protein ACYCVH_12150 [Ignavibacteriaceae bacterium]
MLSLEGNRLNIYSEDPDTGKILNNHEDYIQKKTNEFFGKKLKFELKQNCSATSKAATSLSKPKAQEKNSVSSTDNPLVDSIINLLGGEEIR